ncbi:hypothetical protein BDV98DRAFT_251365 [Pterulicium gracile]|uniref:Secreted protein n=1 Tax=Pterulicium gracile TaxID=1884261 RepID=A0A5C3QCB4_9AGAR|nr:hypothetical protein BDV98DRAFT_251365 [Pterula gracilis]
MVAFQLALSWPFFCTMTYPGSCYCRRCSSALFHRRTTPSLATPPSSQLFIALHRIEYSPWPLFHPGFPLSSASSCFLFLFSRRFFLPSSFQFHHGYRPQYLIPITVYSCIGGMHRLSIWFSFLCSVCDVRRRGSDVGWMD